MTDRDRARLQAVHPVLAERMARVLAAMEALGHPMTVTCGLRSQAEQARLYQQGRTTPGAIVTHADGVKVPSRHQSGRAVDCAFMVDNAPSWRDDLPWKAYGYAGIAVGLTWGGLWRGLGDRPHLELPQEIP